jgi:transcriptional regulator with XRE-family HTH domain
VAIVLHSTEPSILRLVRQERGYTQTELARRARVNRHTVGRYERGGVEALTPELDRILWVLGVGQVSNGRGAA